uniref:SMP-LTD domain-containing protein n=1 Tax=Arundo donax TaxID=35708 RepID=A0A0A9D139_ARUDO
MAVAFLLGFLFGLLALALAQGAVLLWALRSLRRPKGPPPPPPTDATAQLPDDAPLPCDKQGSMWMLEQEKIPKVSSNRLSAGSNQENKEKKNIVEVFPVNMLAKLQGHSLSLSGPDGSHITIDLLNCTAVAVSASNLPSRKWAKRYPIKLESKESEICKGSKVCFLYADTSWEKESWCKALRLASTVDKEKLKLHAMLTEEFRSYISSLNAGYPCFLKSSVFSGEEHVVLDTAVKTDGSSKVRRFLKKFAKKASIKASHESKTSPVLSKQYIKQPSTPSSSMGYNSQLFDSADTNVDEKLVDEGTLCWNLLFSRLFFDAKMNDEICKAIKARIQRTLSNIRTPVYIGEIMLNDLNLGKLPPYVRRMRVLPLDLNELWAFEVDFEYSSGILLHIETRLEVQEPELQKDIMKTTLKDDSGGDVNSDFLDSIEHYGNQFRSSQSLGSAMEDNGEADALRKSKITGWTSTYMSRWKYILHSIADHVSQVPFSLTLKVSSVRGTMRVHIKPSPSDQIWYGFTSMPELEWELESSVGDRKITNSHIASLISNRIKASLHQSLVLPNCESIPISWMISDKDDWVPRKVAPFIWLNPETTETASHTADTTTSHSQPGDAAVSSKATVSNRANKSSPPAPSTRSNESPKNTISVHGLNQEPAAEASTRQSSQVSASAASLESDDANDQLMMPLLSCREFQEEHDSRETRVGSSLERAVVVAAGEQQLPAASPEPGEDMKRKRGRRARVMDLGRRMGDKLEEKRRHMEEKGKHIVDKMRENARSNSLPDLERATPAPAPS